MKKKQIICVLVLLCGLLSIGGTVSEVHAATVYDPRIVPSQFSTRITNPYFSLPIGLETRSTGTTEEGTETIIVTVSGETKVLMGVKTLVYRDKVWLDDVLIEDTTDYLAQDKQGNVWYFGEDVNNYEDGKLKDHKGSWLAGVDGALPGIWMKANPKVGETYRQEYYKDNAEDEATILSLTETVKVPYGTFTNCLKTLDANPLETGTEEHKYYCKQVQGFALEVGVKSGERIELKSTSLQNTSIAKDTEKITHMETLINLLRQLLHLLIEKNQQNTIHMSDAVQNHTVTPAMSTLFTKKITSMSSNTWSVESVTYDPMCNGAEAYDVTALDTHGVKKSFIFDRAGTFIQSEVDAPFETAPSALLQILKEKYASYTYGDTYERLTMANGEARFLVDISEDGGKTDSEIILSTDGKLLCQSK